jgi:hypothetical protein
MSQDAHQLHDRGDAVPYARCRRETGGRYVGFRSAPYCGTQRAPSRPDERGAVCVVDCIAGGRLLIFAIAGDKEWMRVLELREVAHAPAAEAVAGAVDMQRAAA